MYDYAGLLLESYVPSIGRIFALKTGRFLGANCCRVAAYSIRIRGVILQRRTALATGHTSALAKTSASRHHPSCAGITRALLVQMRRTTKAVVCADVGKRGTFCVSVRSTAALIALGLRRRQFAVAPADQKPVPMEEDNGRDPGNGGSRAKTSVIRET